MKTNLEDLTFLIPIRLDSIIRLENLIATIDYIWKSFKTHIFVLEAAPYNNNVINSILKNKIEYYFIEDKDPIFYRTKYLNVMARNAQTPFLSIWDADVIIDKKQIIDCMSRLRKNETDIAFPYDGNFMDTSPILKSLFFKSGNIGDLHRNKERMKLLYGPNHKGGAIIVNAEKYKFAGMENENFYGWGPEDFERYERWSNLKFRIYRSKGCLYHLSHPRSINSGFNSNYQMKYSNNEFGKTKASSKQEIMYHFSKLSDK